MEIRPGDNIISIFNDKNNSCKLLCLKTSAITLQQGFKWSYIVHVWTGRSHLITVLGKLPTPWKSNKHYILLFFLKLSDIRYNLIIQNQVVQSFDFSTWKILMLDLTSCRITCLSTQNSQTSIKTSRGEFEINCMLY